MTDRFRILVARQRGHLLRRWRWTVEEKTLSRGWRLTDDGTSFSRANALALSVGGATRRFQVERIEIEAVVGYRPIPEKPAKPSPLSPELLDKRAGA